jgi:phage shock protein PspC (stress-responsive transcriptional regulator)
MTNPPPPSRRLTRSTTDRYLGGVCGGVARYFNLDPTLVRVLTVALTVTTGSAFVLVYIAALFVMPEDEQYRPPAPPRTYPPAPAPGPRPAPPTGPGDPIWGREGAPWEQPHDAPPEAPHGTGPDSPRDPS